MTTTRELFNVRTPPDALRVLLAELPAAIRPSTIPTARRARSRAGRGRPRAERPADVPPVDDGRLRGPRGRHLRRHRGPAGYLDLRGEVLMGQATPGRADESSVAEPIATQARWPVRFALVGMLFLIFDVESRRPGSLDRGVCLRIATRMPAGRCGRDQHGRTDPRGRTGHHRDAAAGGAGEKVVQLAGDPMPAPRGRLLVPLLAACGEMSLARRSTRCAATTSKTGAA